MHCYAAERLFTASALHRVVDRSGLPFCVPSIRPSSGSVGLLAVDDTLRIIVLGFSNVTDDSVISFARNGVVFSARRSCTLRMTVSAVSDTEKIRSPRLCSP